nr:glycosyltransferase [Thermoanaerobaculia bacterium]
MRIAFVVERPTQFEAPFYKHVAETESAHRLAVIFTGGAPAESSFDPELGRQVGWGFDLTSGYPWKAAPASGSASWLEEELGSERPDLVIINGYTQRPYLQALRAAHSLRLPVALRIDSTLFASGARRRWLKAMIFAGFLLPAFDLFFAVGGQSRRYLLAHGVARERIALFPYAVDVAGFASASRQGAAERERLRLDRMETPVGTLAIVADERGALRAVGFEEDRPRLLADANQQDADAQANPGGGQERPEASCGEAAPRQGRQASHPALRAPARRAGRSVGPRCDRCAGQVGSRRGCGRRARRTRDPRRPPPSRRASPA